MIIAIDLGGTNIKMALCGNGGILETANVKSDLSRGLADNLEPVRRLVDAWMMSNPGTIRLVGLGYPGLVNPDKGVILGSNAKYEEAVGFDFDGWCRETFGIGAVVDNDASAALLGEMHYGAAKGSKNAVLLTLGTGIGAAASMNGRLVRGVHYQAACLLGHMPVGGDTRCPGCGGMGCAESVAGSWALRRQVARSDIDSPLKREGKVDFNCLRQYVERGDVLAEEIYDKCLRAWSACLKTLIYAYDPEIVVISGGVARWGDSLLQDLRRSTLDGLYSPWGVPTFVRAKDMDQSVLYGLYQRCIDHLSQGRDSCEAC